MALQKHILLSKPCLPCPFETPLIDHLGEIAFEVRMATGEWKLTQVSGANGSSIAQSLNVHCNKAINLNTMVNGTTHAITWLL